MASRVVRYTEASRLHSIRCLLFFFNYYPLYDRPRRPHDEDKGEGYPYGRQHPYPFPTNFSDKFQDYEDQSQ